MDEKKIEQLEVDINGWFAVCDAEGAVQVIFPGENFARWYLEKYGWSRWMIRPVAAGKSAGNLFLLKEQHRRAEDDEHQAETEI